MRLGNPTQSTQKNTRRNSHSLTRFRAVIMLMMMMLCCSQTVLAATLKLSTDRSFVMAGDTFALEVQLDDSNGRGIPQAVNAFDSALEVFSGPSISSNTTIINGKRSASTTWTWQIMAQKAGKFTIPAFKLNGLKTRPGRIEVKPATNAPSDNSQDIIVSLEADKTTALIGEQILLSWKVMFKTNVRGNVQPPESPASFETVQLEPNSGKDYVSTIDNEPYEVKEFRQVVFATEPGEFTIKPIYFKGTYKPSQSRSSRHKDISLGSQAVKVTINPAPTVKTSQTKIPMTTKLQISSQWTIPDAPIDIGEPIALEVHMSAPGQISSRLPDLTFQSTSSLKIYDDGEETREDSQWSIGTTGYRTQKFAIIPQKPGTYTIPETQIAWWNTETNILEYTTIAGKTIEIADAAGLVRQANSVPLNGVIDPNQAPDDIVDDINNSLSENNPITDILNEADNELWNNLTAIFALLWLITGLYAYRSIQQKRRAKQDAENGASNHKSLSKKNSKRKQATGKNRDTEINIADLSDKQLQMKLVPILELHYHDVEPREACGQFVSLLCAWATERSVAKPKNITQLRPMIKDNDPWIPILKECEAFLYSQKQTSWPKEAIREALVTGLPALRQPPAEKASKKQTIAPFTP